MSTALNFTGVHTALVTPFLDGEVSYACLERLLEHQLSQGIQGIVPVGTTGESPTLSTPEHLEVIHHTIKTVNNRCLVIAGVGSNSTEEAIHLSQAAEKAGADALLHVTPYYNKPNQEGLYLHFSKIAEAVRIPIVLYSIPGRCVIEITPETTARLFEKHPHICAIKESGENPERVTALRNTCGNTFQVLSGDDKLVLPFLERGAVGLISVASNIAVSPLVELVRAYLSGDTSRAAEIDARYQGFFHSLFLDPNPVPIKQVLAWAGLIKSPEVRLPLAPILPQTRETLEAAWNALQA